MRLSTVDAERAQRTLLEALAAGVNFIDTADVYGADGADRHGNERWLGRYLGPDVTVATKGGLVRGSEGGRWRPDGRAKALISACAGSRTALGRPIDLYLLHAPDPRTSLSTSARALGRLLEDGAVLQIGLCNVGVDQVREAERHAPIRAVQVELSPFDGHAIRSGVIEYCQARGFDVFAHSPFGGPSRARRLERDPVLKGVADSHGVSPYAVVLAWLHDLGVVPLPGPTRPEHARDAAVGAQLSLTAADRRTLDERFPLGAWLRAPRSVRRPKPSGKGEVVIVMGLPAAGKTTAARAFVERGYVRFNRDEQGGTLAKLHRHLDRHLADDERSVVLDNTYTTRAARHEVLEVAWRHGRSVRCLWIDTPLPAAQLNAVRRLWTLFGEVPGPDRIKAARSDPQVFGPDVQVRFQKTLEPPSEDEGFIAVERHTFAPPPWPAGQAGLIVAEEALSSPVVRERRRSEPMAIVAWWPGIEPSKASLRIEQLEADGATVFACTHGPTQRCWCLLPLPGLGYAAIRTLGLDPRRCRWIGRGAVHRRASQAVDMSFVDVAHEK